MNIDKFIKYVAIFFANVALIVCVQDENIGYFFCYLIGGIAAMISLWTLREL